jgi:rod shape-determining protein MreD
MRSYVRGALGIGLAFGLYTILGRVASPALQLFSVFTLTVIWFGQRHGELFGAIMGSASGLVVDAFSLGVFGVSGLTLTVTGYLAGYVSRKINVLSFLKTFVFLALLTFIESVLWLAMVTLLVSQKAGRTGTILLVRPLVTAAVGAVVFAWLRRWLARHGK